MIKNIFSMIREKINKTFNQKKSFSVLGGNPLTPISTLKLFFPRKNVVVILRYAHEKYIFIISGFLHNKLLILINNVLCNSKAINKDGNK